MDKHETFHTQSSPIHPSLIGKEAELQQIANMLIDHGYSEESFDQFYAETPILTSTQDSTTSFLASLCEDDVTFVQFNDAGKLGK